MGVYGRGYFKGSATTNNVQLLCIWENFYFRFYLSLQLQNCSVCWIVFIVFRAYRHIEHCYSRQEDGVCRHIFHRFSAGFDIMCRWFEAALIRCNCCFNEWFQSFDSIRRRLTPLYFTYFIGSLFFRAEHTEVPVVGHCFPL